MMKKPIVKFSLSCDDVIVHENKKISLIGVFEQITTTAFPLRFPKFALITRWSGGEGEFTLRIRLLDPQKKKALEESKGIKVEFKSEGHYHNDILYLGDAEFEAPGVYWIESSVDGESVHYEPLNLVHKKVIE
jgi:hypothetical protein